jgi:hypothetical protein
LSPASDERRYIRAVEAAWSKVLGRPAVVSPREFAAIDGWRRRGVPLTVVLEVIGEAGKRGSGGSGKALTGLARAVEDAWSVVAAGRVTQEAAGSLPARSDARHAWQACLARCPEGVPLRTLLVALLAQEAGGVPGPALDAALDDALPGAVPAVTLKAAREETDGALRAFRGRMSDEELQATFARALVDRLRATLGLPRLALTR